MAFEMQREYSLPVVAVRLSMEHRTPCAQLRLLVNVDGQPEVHDERTLWLSEFGYGATTKSVASGLFVPPGVAAWIGGWTRAKLVDGDPLWLHLVKPYGTLGAIPWEHALQPATDRPLLRLPDVFPDPEQSTTTYDLVFVAAAPAGALPGEIPDALAALARVEHIRLHVFCDTRVGASLRAIVAAAPNATLYPVEPTERLSYTGELRNPWFRWIRRALAGRSADAVHFVVPGAQLGAQGALTLPYRPDDPDTAPTMVQAGEIAAFLTRMGALTVGFTRPAGNYSDYGLRRVADDLGAMRAGPVLLHEPADATGTTELTECYDFLADFRPAAPPASPRILLYAQPRRVRRPAGREPAEPLSNRAPMTRSAAVSKHFDRDATPAWLGAAQRYIEQKEGELRRFHDWADSSNPNEAAYYAGIESGLEKVRAVVERHAEREP
ncbi:hypothetical protein JK358_36015 [Nocardia sp. 2]|uniref:Uncharacterized protein n=1 Tax=Nocardia acididurans TaxID=2802282 RepID=A0ABS1MKP2_9NOCA|nr:hypothetical protein [Nocardia acididurans]MBL1079823.1 hypothetical protein [Nocardia acididurans]